ncbi:MAG: hypothetical protein ACRED5_08025 [Propylenella sp.]
MHTGLSTDVATALRRSQASRVRSVLGNWRRWLRIRKSELPWQLWRGAKAPRGSPDWLIRREIRYGGFVTDVPRTVVSPADPRSPVELRLGGMSGGDRMLHHGYAETYARFLRPFLSRKDIVLAEFGVLSGSGLAIWCDLFPDASILGFDVDLGHFESNAARLQRRGAFRRNWPELHKFDQLLDGPERLEAILAGRRLAIVADDGLHTAAAILNTWRTVKPHLAPDFVYFVEDFAGLFDKAGGEFEGFDCQSFGLMSVVLPRKPQN